MNSPLMRIRGRRRAAISAALAMSLGGAALAAKAAVPFETVTVAYETAPLERVLDGTVEAVNEATLSAETSGRIAAIHYDVGEFVEAGAPLVRFTDTEQRAALDAAEAALSEAEARRTEAESEHERVASMYANATVSQARYDQAGTSLAAATARLEAARAAVAGAAEQFEYTIVRAPYAAILSARHVEVGEFVRPGAPLIGALSLENLRVGVDVPQTMIEPVRRFGRAIVHADDRDIEAHGLTFFPIADAGARTLRVRVQLPPDATPLYPGTFVKVGFIVGETERLSVPAAAVVRRSELTAVYVVAGDEVSLRQIRAGRQQGDRVEVLAGLDAGEAVATDPVSAGVYREQRRR